MKILQKTLPVHHNLFLFGDDHEGTKLRHDRGWDRLLDMMNSEYEGCSNNYGVDHGDIIEAIPSSDKRWLDKDEKHKVIWQKERAIKNREPIKDKLVAVLNGNHPDKYWRFGDMTEEICEKLGVQYGTYSTHITFKTTRENVIYRHYATHGAKSIGTVADDPVRQHSNMLLQLKRQLKNKFADCVLMSKGHTHKLLVCRPTHALYLTALKTKPKQAYTSYDPTGQYIHPDHRYYINTGSFLRLFAQDYSGYAERAEYDPIELGFCIVRVRDRMIIDVDKIVLESPKEETIDVEAI